jgi:hypothetical protein
VYAIDHGVPSSLYNDPETLLMQSSQLSGTANVVSNGGIMVDGMRRPRRLLCRLR